MRPPELSPLLPLLLALTIAGGCAAEAEPGPADGSTPPIGCTGPADCPSETVCGAFACLDGVCVATRAEPAGPITSQLGGDCRSVECDGEGRLVELVDPADVYDDGNECTNDGCSDGVPVNAPIAPEGTSCDGGAGLCSSTGECVECLTDATCPYPRPICDANRCLAAICFDGVLYEPSETDVDCGGTGCAPCGDGKSCVLPSDCESQHCSGPTVDTKTCQPATCGDGVENADETDVDCGGPLCTTLEGGLCGDAKGCAHPSDCESGVCAAGVCQSPSCEDGVMNGLEDGVDCGQVCTADCLL